MAEFEYINFIKEVPLNILKFRADTHDFGCDNGNGWESEYLRELHKTLKRDDIVFDIGAEHGEFTAFAAKIVGAANVHIIEPNIEYWPNIKAVWDENFKESPASCFCGFFSHVSDTNIPDNVGWPVSADGDIFMRTNQLVTYDKNNDHIPKITMDDYCYKNKVVPNIIMIDCEGAEVDIIDGGKNILLENNAIVFISVHSEGCISMYGRKKEELFYLFNKMGYNSSIISIDHEEHWKFYKS